MGGPDERALRDLLEQAQSRVLALEDEADHLSAALDDERRAREALVLVVDDLRGALERVAFPEREAKPGEGHEVVKLRAQVHVLKHSLARAEETVHALATELKKLKGGR
ncbi:MAG: hypothetical protein U0228_33175 [Myxococcaceae bacterium]